MNHKIIFILMESIKKVLSTDKYHVDICSISGYNILDSNDVKAYDLVCITSLYEYIQSEKRIKVKHKLSNDFDFSAFDKLIEIRSLPGLFSKDESKLKLEQIGLPERERENDEQYNINLIDLIDEELKHNNKSELSLVYI